MSEPLGDKVVKKIFGHEQEYWTGVGALVIFNWALILFASTPLLPEPNPLLWIEFMIIASSFIGLIGLIADAVNKWHVVSRWSFLWTFFSAMLVIFGFVIGEAENVDLVFRIDVLLFILVGAFISVHMHVSYGGKD